MRIAVIGLGYWGPNLARNIAASGHAELVALCDMDQERLDRVAATYPSARAYASLDALLGDPQVEAVAIATPVATHFDMARVVLESGRHALVEKPLATTTDQAEELQRIASAAGLTLMVDHVFLYSPAVRAVRQLVEKDELGDLLFIDSVRINLGIFQHDINVLWDLAPHDLSIIDHLVGRSPHGVRAVGSARAGNGLASAAYLHLDFGDGFGATVHVNWLSPVKIRHFLVGGTRRSVLYNDLDRSEPVKVYDRGIDIMTDPEDRRRALVSYRSGDVISPRVDGVEPLSAVIEDFAACARDGSSPVANGGQGVRIVRILEAADRSLSAGGSYEALGT